MHGKAENRNVNTGDLVKGVWNKQHRHGVIIEKNAQVTRDGDQSTSA